MKQNNILRVLGVLVLLLTFSFNLDAKKSKQMSKDNPFFEYNYKIWKLDKMVSQTGGNTTKNYLEELKKVKASKAAAVRKMKMELVVKKTDLEKKLQAIKTSPNQENNNAKVETNTKGQDKVAPTNTLKPEKKSAEEETFDKLDKQFNEKLNAMEADDSKAENDSSTAMSEKALKAELKKVKKQLKKIDKWSKETYIPSKKKRKKSISSTKKTSKKKATKNKKAVKKTKEKQ